MRRWAPRTSAEAPPKAHGPVEARRIATVDLLPEAFAAFAGARQAFRVVRERTDAKTGTTSTETAYGLSSLPAGHGLRTAARLEPRPLAGTGRWRTATTTASTPGSSSPQALRDH